MELREYNRKDFRIFQRLNYENKNIILLSNYLSLLKREIRRYSNMENFERSREITFHGEIMCVYKNFVFFVVVFPQP